MNRPHRRHVPALMAVLLALGGLPLLASLPVAADGSRVVIAAGVGAFSASAPQQVLDALSAPTGYELSNGQRLQLEARGESLRMRYGSRGHVTLRADEQNQFVSNDRQLVLQVAVNSFGEAHRLRLSMPGDWQ